MEKEKFLKLLSRKLSGAISTAETEALNQAIASNAAYRELAQHIQPHQQPVGSKPAQLDAIWSQIHLAEKQGFTAKYDYAAPKSQFSYAAMLKIAAIFVFVIGTGILSYTFFYPSANAQFTIASTNEKIFKVMEDGTKIWLNKNSAMRYNKAFGKQQREIFLDGEAYFEVTKNKAVPLFIHAKNITIEVKGTVFNVNAYPTKPVVEVALLKGLIEVSNTENNLQKILLHPNQKLLFPTVAKQNESFVVLPIAADRLLNEVKWTLDTLNFSKEKLKDLALRMEKKYDLKIEIQSEQLKEKRFSGTFTDETINQALEALKLSYPLTYTISNRLVVIKN